MLQIPEMLQPLLGEVAWYSVILDPRIESESSRHYDLVHSVLKQFGQAFPPNPRILEIASYAHTTGYRLARQQPAQVTLFEISRHSLRLGRSLAGAKPGEANPRLVAGDFHALPFADAAFDLVYICSALHHTRKFQTVLREMMRVVAPGGLLFLENEPSNRRICFHKFRCNRPEQFTPFENHLKKLDLLRTMAEPYVGSRPEQLFNMIENQTMPLSEILVILGELGELEMLELTPEQCMGNREWHWLQWRNLPAAKAAKNLLADLTAGCREALTSFSARDRGMGFSLPSTGELESLAAAVGPELAALPADPTCPEYRYGISCLFGAPVRLVWRKQGATAHPPAAVGSQGEADWPWPCEDGIYETYPPAVRELLAQPSLLPEIQRVEENELHAWFSPEEWLRVKSPEGIVSLTNRGASVHVHLPPTPAATSLLVLRIFGSVIPGGYYELRICCGGHRLFSHGFYGSESILFVEPLARDILAAQGWQLNVELLPLPERECEPLMSIAASYAGFFPLQGSLESLARVLEQSRPPGPALAGCGKKL